MIQSAAEALAKQWAKNGVIHQADIEAYQYGMELMLSTLINIVVMIGLSIAFGHIWLFIPYLAAFIPLRLSAGGYHAKHHLNCILLNAIAYFTSLVAVSVLKEPVAILACIIESGVSLILIFLFSPVPARNKPLSTEERKMNRHISLGLGFLFLILCMLFYYTQILALTWCKILFCGQTTATLLLVLGTGETINHLFR